MTATLTMSDADGSQAGAATRRDLTVEVSADMAAAEGVWRALESVGSASPYQRFDWVSAYVAHAGRAERIRIAIVRDADQPVMLLGLSISHRRGLRIASGVGGKHANFHLPLASGSGALSQQEMGGVLREIGRRLSLDLFTFANVPTHWGGRASAFATGGMASSSNAYATRLDPDPEATAQRVLSTQSRKRLRQKERYLAKLGTVGFLAPSSDAEIDRVLKAFFRQKEQRFRTLGIADPFLAPEQRAFIYAASRPRAEGTAALQLYALTLDDVIVSTFGGAIDAHRISGMFLSFEEGHEAARYSPGDVLVSRIIAESCRRGLDVFDLGVGEARYKGTFCNVTQNLVDVVVPVTLRGRLSASLIRSALGLKRRIKQDPRAMRWVALIRRAKPTISRS